MKKTILPAHTLLFISSSTLHAQVNNGNFLLGGSIGFGAGETENYNSTSNSGISPRMGYAIGRNKTQTPRKIEDIPWAPSRVSIIRPCRNCWCMPMRAV